MRSLASLGSVALILITATAAASSSSKEIERGKELFLRTWVPWDERGVPGGDGLGPMYNASSCVACHSAGGVGGGGPKDRNVRLVKPSGATSFVVDHRLSTLTSKPVPPSEGTKAERNSPALFGAGQIDAIPDQLLLDLAAGQPKETRGRVARTADGRVGRFGWKGHTASLVDFVSVACANELGLSVDGHPQGQPPEGDLAERLDLMQQTLARFGKEVDLRNGPGRDMSQRDVLALTAYIGSLPAPRSLPGQPGTEEGHALFTKAGCEGCHVGRLGQVQGIYSDLLLHDLGRNLSDSAGTYETRGNIASAATSTGTSANSSVVPAQSAEWRTPPLWGVRDSAPYLHDGRAPTLDDAIRAHGGQAESASMRYRALSLSEQQLLLGFLDSLAAPTGT